MDPNINFSRHKIPRYPVILVLFQVLKQNEGSKVILRRPESETALVKKDYDEMLYSFNVTTSSLVGCIMTALKCSLLIQGFNDNVVGVFLSGLH
jgi:hypothetical protein